MTLIRRLRSRETFRSGYDRWRRGDLDEAERLLREAAQRRPRRRGALLYLARVLSERGDLAGAIDALDEARGAGAHPEVVEIFLGLVRYDHEQPASKELPASSAGTANVLSRSLETLGDLRERLLRRGAESSKATPQEARLPLAARWIAEVSGRALALLDRALLLREPEGRIRLHHGLLVEAYFGIEPEEAPGATGETRGLDDATTAFLHRDYATVASVPGRDAALAPSPTVAVCRTFSLMALGKPSDALRCARTIGEEPAHAPEASFLEGLAHSAAGRVTEAGWCFTRAARYRDIEVDQVLERVSSALPLRWVWDDSP